MYGTKAEEMDFNKSSLHFLMLNESFIINTLRH